MGIADHSCAPAPSRAILPEEAVGALVFDVELLDVKPAPKADAKPEADAKAADSAKK